MEHEQSDAEEPRHYSQAAADAMHRELTKARARIRRYRCQRQKAPVHVPPQTLNQNWTLHLHSLH